MKPAKSVHRRKALQAMGVAGIGALGAGTLVRAADDKPKGKGTLAKIDPSRLETFRPPAAGKTIGPSGGARIAAVSSIVGVASHRFEFRENTNTPGRLLEQSVVVNVPSGAGFFTAIPLFSGAFTSSDFTTLGERPLGQFFVAIGLRGNNLVCQVRLTDSNSDDPIDIVVDGLVVFYQ